VIENEVKLGAPPGFHVPPLDDVYEGITARARPDLVMQATYYDTPDLRLTRAGASLRYRSNDGWTVKLPTEDLHQGALHRSEFLIKGPPTAPPPLAFDLVRAYARTAPLGVVSRLRTLRRTVELVNEAGEPVAEVDDDEVSVLDGRRVGARFREIEVEVFPGAPDDLQARVVAVLRDAGAGEPDPVPKVVRALGPRALEPPDVVVPKLGKDPTVADAVRAAIASPVRRLIVHDAAVRMGDDPEGVHQARVATRRLRSDLRTFRDYLDPEWAESLREELKWLGAELGNVRDADVMLERLQHHAQRLPDDERLLVERVIARRATERDDARAALLDAYRSSRYVELLERLVAAAQAPAFAAGVDAPAKATLPRVVRGPWQHLRKAVNELGDSPADEALHEVRKRAKRCRYAAEAVAPVVGKPARLFAKAVANVQEVLGEHQDAVVARQWLGKAAADLPAREAYAAGMLAGIELEAAATARARFPAAWKAASPKRLRSWL
jgi:CHAD domain-containing protein